MNPRPYLASFAALALLAALPLAAAEPPFAFVAVRGAEGRMGEQTSASSDLRDE